MVLSLPGAATRARPARSCPRTGGPHHRSNGNRVVRRWRGISAVEWTTDVHDAHGAHAPRPWSPDLAVRLPVRLRGNLTGEAPRRRALKVPAADVQPPGSRHSSDYRGRPVLAVLMVSRAQAARREGSRLACTLLSTRGAPRASRRRQRSVAAPHDPDLIGRRPEAAIAPGQAILRKIRNERIRVAGALGVVASLARAGKILHESETACAVADHVVSVHAPRVDESVAVVAPAAVAHVHIRTLLLLGPSVARDPTP